jgi:multimeric flavodoxin WrbA
LGSPRRDGNSAALAGHFLRHVQELGAETLSFTLNDLSIRGCQACEACKTDLDGCVLQDGLGEVLDAVFHADLIVFASPVYYGDVSAQLKTFIDRTYSYLRPRYIALEHPSRLPKRKPLVFILSQGHRDPSSFDDILPRYSKLLYWTGFADVYPIRAIDVYHPGDVQKKCPELFEELERLATQLTSN